MNVLNFWQKVVFLIVIVLVALNFLLSVPIIINVLFVLLLCATCVIILIAYISDEHIWIPQSRGDNLI